MVINNAPLLAPYPVEKYVSFSLEDCKQRKDVCGRDSVPFLKHPEKCQQLVHIGVFFDGTNNNMQRDKPVKGHSNIVRLYDAHRDDQNTHFKFYIPGVGTPFPEIGEMAESTNGKAFAEGGQARLLYALMQMYNAVHRSVLKGPCFDPATMKDMLKRYSREVERAPTKNGPEPLSRAEWCKKEVKEKARNLRRELGRSKPEIINIIVSVFGFSRGAVEAAAFCHWFAELMDGDGERQEMAQLNLPIEAGPLFVGRPVEIRFLGMMDAVASVGLPDSVAFNTGHHAWAGVVLDKPLPALVKNAVHFIAAHEQRENFPSTQPPGAQLQSWLYPGVHSDVGGGYGPGEHGRSPQVADLLSQIPLVHMYKAALMAGVALTQWVQLEPRVQQDFQISADLRQAYEDYMRTLDLPEAGAYMPMVQKHMELYYLWRGVRQKSDMGDFSGLRRCNDKQTRENIRSFNDLLQGDMRLLQMRERRGDPDGRRWDVDQIRANRVPKNRARSGQALSAWEQWVFKVLRLHLPLPHGVGQWFDVAAMPSHKLLDDFVHDSLACFVLSGFVTSWEREVYVRKLLVKEKVSAEKEQLGEHGGVYISSEDKALLVHLRTACPEIMTQLHDKALALRKLRIDQEEADQFQNQLDIPEQEQLAQAWPLEVDTKGAFDKLLFGPTRREANGYLRPRNAFGVGKSLWKTVPPPVQRAGSIVPQSGSWRPQLPAGHSHERKVAGYTAVSCAQGRPFPRLGSLLPQDELLVSWQWVDQEEV
ncbi:DUF2235 domain-containing protein [Neisseriaceae bacterium TC5R-5]|nr:DUF2235 domain-containing protein [Neisseriaceae bacterium TC5R-5]